MKFPRREFLHLAAGAAALAGHVAHRQGARLSVAAGAHLRRLSPPSIANTNLYSVLMDTPFAVGTRVTSRPPPRSVRAAFPHTAPTSGIDGSSLP